MSLRLFVLGKQMSGHLWRLEFSLFSSFPGEQILFWASVNRIYLWAVYLFPAVIHFPSPCYLSKNGASLTGLDLMGVLCSRSVVVWLYNCCKWLLCCENKKHSGEDFFFLLKKTAACCGWSVTHLCATVKLGLFGDMDNNFNDTFCVFSTGPFWTSFGYSFLSV